MTPAPMGLPTPSWSGQRHIRGVWSTSGPASAARARRQALNQGLEQVMSDDWAEAILIADADVQFEPATLRRMTRHLADPRVGAVTAYIKEGSHRPGYLNRFIGFEYVTAQAAARRSPERPGRDGLPGRWRPAPQPGQPRGHRRPHRLEHPRRGHRRHLRDAAPGQASHLRAPCGRVGGGARRPEQPLEAAPALGPGQPPGDPALPGCLVPADEAGTAWRHHLRACLVHGAAPAHLDDRRIRRAPAAPAAGGLPGMGGLPCPLDRNAVCICSPRHSPLPSIRASHGSHGARGCVPGGSCPCPSSDTPACRVFGSASVASARSSNGSCGLAGWLHAGRVAGAAGGAPPGWRLYPGRSLPRGLRRIPVSGDAHGIHPRAAGRRAAMGQDGEARPCPAGAHERSWPVPTGEPRIAGPSGPSTAATEMRAGCRGACCGPARRSGGCCSGRWSIIVAIAAIVVASGIHP